MTEHDRINAEFVERMRWWRSPEGIAHRKMLDEFYAAEDARHEQRFVDALIVGVSELVK